MSQVPPGWEGYGTPDTADGNGPFGTYNLSPDGGTFVRAFSWQRDSTYYSQREGIGQRLDGFASGQLYSVSFYQTSVNGINALSGQPVSGAAGQWSLTLDGLTVGTSQLMSPPAGTSLNNTWSLQTISFVSTASSHLLGFLATVPDSAPVETRTFMGIDGIVVTIIPEPTTFTLLGLSSLALVFVRQRR